MSILVIAEHDNASLKASTLNTVTAARELGEDVHVLVVGNAVDAAAGAAAAVAGVAKVLKVDAPYLGQPTAENLAAAALAVIAAGNYSHVLAPATSFGKNVAPRIAAKLDVAPRLATLKVTEPPKRKGGGRVADVKELVAKLRNEAKVLS